VREERILKAINQLLSGPRRVARLAGRLTADFRPGDLVDLLRSEPSCRLPGRRPRKCDLRIWSIHDQG
jgi:hypothetical protein